MDKIEIKTKYIYIYIVRFIDLHTFYLLLIQISAADFIRTLR